MDELKLFLYTANKVGLDPLTKQIHFVKRGGAGTIQVAIDGYRAIAERTHQLAGIDDAIYDDEKGVHPNKATVTVYRMVENQRVPFTATARWAEYAPTGNMAFMWNKMPYLMLAKCAEALALRKAFPNDLSGIYTNEEMQQADTAKKMEGMYADTMQKIGKLPDEQKVKALENALESGVFSQEEMATMDTYKQELIKTLYPAPESAQNDGELTYVDVK